MSLFLLWITSSQITIVVAKPKQEPQPAPYDKVEKGKGDGKHGKDKDVDQIVPDVFQPWIARGCMPLKRLLNRKSFADRKLILTMDKIRGDKSLSDAEKKYHLQTFRIFSQVCIPS